MENLTRSPNFGQTVCQTLGLHIFGATYHGLMCAGSPWTNPEVCAGGAERHRLSSHGGIW